MIEEKMMNNTFTQLIEYTPVDLDGFILQTIYLLILTGFLLYIIYQISYKVSIE